MRARKAEELPDRGSAVADLGRTVAGLRRQLDERAAELQASTAERNEALERHAASAEVLQ
jgi:hypothetical protein